MGRLVIVTTQNWDYARWMHDQVSSAPQSHRKVPFSLLRTSGAGCARTPAWSGSGCGCGCQSPWPSIDPLHGLRRTHAQQEQRILGLHSSEPGGVHEDDGPRTYLFGQCRRGGIQHMGCCTPHLSCVWLVLGPWGAQATTSGSCRDRR